jgi:hypothetical protein
MPELSRFLGMSVLMHFNDHPPPHFHIRYNEYRAIMRINDLEITEGGLPPRVAALALEWASLHRAELMANWESITSNGTWARIAPLV